MIDTHCHFDFLQNPEKYISEHEALGDTIIGMTNCPLHYEMGRVHVRNYKHIRLALGFHPQLVSKIKEQIHLFRKYVDSTSYIGEIGLDFSKEYKDTESIQIQCLRSILICLQGKKKIISVHSRMAEDVLLSLLEEYNIDNVIFHWYTGKLSTIQKIVERGYYFSINESMTLSANGKKIIDKIPHDRILTETDAPYNRKCNIPNAIKNLGMTGKEIEQNFYDLINKIR